MKNLIILASLACFCGVQNKAASYFFGPNALIPDGSLSGLSDVHSIGDSYQIGSLSVSLSLAGVQDGGFNGDLYAYLQHGPAIAILLNRPGRTGENAWGYDDGGMSVTFDDAGASNGDIHNYESSLAYFAPLSGVWETDGRNVDPEAVTDASARTTSLQDFLGLDVAGDWTLYIADVSSGATTRLDDWSLSITAAEIPEEPPVEPVPEPAFWGSFFGAALVAARAAFKPAKKQLK